MFKIFTRINNVVANFSINTFRQNDVFLYRDLPSINQCRTTTILRRVRKVKLLKKYADPLNFRLHKKKERIYEVEQMTHLQKEGNIDVILKQFIQGLGNKGEVVSVKRSLAYNELLIPGLAMYATEEEKQKTKLNVTKDSKDEHYSSIFVPRTMEVLSTKVYSLVMNKENDWVIEPWHVRAALRKAGVHIMDEACIRMPETKLQGPDMNLEGKEFFVTITINNEEKVKTRLRIHHWSTELADRLPPVPLHWTKRAEPLFESEKEELDTYPVAPSPLKEDEQEA